MSKKRQAARIYLGREDVNLAVKWSESGTPNLEWPVAPQISGLLCIEIDLEEDVISPAVHMAGDSGPGVANLEELREVLKPWRAVVSTTCRGLGLPAGRWRTKFEAREWYCHYVMPGQVTSKNTDSDVDIRELTDKLLCLAHFLYGYRTGLEEASA